MNLWAGQLAPCVFCEYRALLRSHSRRIQSQRLHTADRPLRVLRLGARSEPIKKFANDRSIRRSSRDDAFRIHYERRGKSIEKADPSKSDIEKSLRAAVLRSLEHLKLYLQSKRVRDDKTISLYDALDPNKKHWSTFADDLRFLVSQNLNKSTEEWDKKHKTLWDKLKKAKKTSEIEDESIAIRKVLHHAFIDYVLKNPKEHQSTFVGRFADLRYPTEWYTGARAAQRDIHLHVGPTNSGKTYNALKRLEEAGNGFYAGPLRLLAHEVYMRFKSKGVPCDLVTGDDVRRDDDNAVQLYSSTVEMVDTTQAVDVAVIDEIQMVAHEDRGWAWTRALLGANAKEVHLCGEVRVIPLIQELAGWMGDTLQIHRYDRLNPLKAMTRSLRGNLKNLRKGDCVVSFSIVGIHALKKQIEIETNRRVAIVYGSLPPETRAQQAAFFNDPENDYDFLVASDAIGMGLNLAIKRVVFETTMKFNGVGKERLSIPQLKQIAGRAGRYRTAYQDANQKDMKVSNPADIRSTQYHATATVGLVTCLDETDLPYIQEALDAEPEPIKAAGILPPTNFVEEYAARLPKGIPFEFVYNRICEVARLHPRFKLCDIKDALSVIRTIESVAGLTVAQRCTIAAAPCDVRTPLLKMVVRDLAKCVAESQSASVVDIPTIPLEILEQPISGEREYLHGLESLHKSLILFLWLSYRFIGVFKDQEMAFHAKRLVEEKINTTLLEFSANPQLRKRLLALQRRPLGMGPELSAKQHVLRSLSNSEPDTREVLDSQPPPDEEQPGPDTVDLVPHEERIPHLASANG